ncbi:hypothetical protein [Chitinophaga vietnamensis]|uniref:hypothetical protein n=1 Tax=Chitinophaga vietnamensis TaxID=2593957 RepID=UPI0011781306|nr:hypothetical protein [Chitinophaga vietnamensis]
MKRLRIKHYLLSATILSTLLVSAALVKSDKHMAVPPATLPLLHTITVNGVPADSIVYDERRQLSAIWFYDDITRHWDAHNEYVVGGNNKVTKIMEYWGDELMRTDSLAWTDSLLIRYTVSHQASAHAAYDTLVIALNEVGKAARVGTPDTLTDELHRFISYDDLLYNGANLSTLRSQDYFTTGTNGNAYIKHENITTLIYDQYRNPFAPLCSSYPGISRETFNENVLFADAANNVVSKTIQETFTGAVNETVVNKISCRYQYDPVTLLPLQQLYEKNETDEDDRPVKKIYHITFTYTKI